MTKFYQQPFAASGDTGTPIPEAVQPSGSVSYAQGFGPDYAREQGVDPLAKDVPREETNQLFKDITDNLAFWQRQGAPEWVTSAQNGGAPLPYAAGAIVRYRPSPGDPYSTYVSQVATSAVPTTATDWTKLDYRFALTSDTTSTRIPVDPAYVAAQLAGVNISVPAASETVAGISEYATAGETIGGSPANRTVTPPGLAAAATAGEWATPAATTVASGRVRLATDGEAIARASNTIAMTPASFGAALPLATTAAIGRARLATAAEATAQTTGAGGPAAVNPEALTGYARLGQNVSFTLVQSSGGFSRTSSERVKRDLRDNPYGLDAVLAIETFVGRYRADYINDPREHVFFSAEQLANVGPLAVIDNGAEYIDLVRAQANLAWVTRMGALSIAGGGISESQRETSADIVITAIEGTVGLATTWPVGDDDKIGRAKRLKIAPGQEPVLAFSGNGGNYRIRFKIKPN